MIRLGLLGTGSTTSVADWHTQGFLKDGRARLTGCCSERTGKTYDAVAVLVDDGEKAQYRLEFGHE